MVSKYSSAKPLSKSARLLDGGRFALGFTVATLLVIFVFLLKELLEPSATRQEVLALTPALLTLLVATVSLMISFYALSEQRIMRQAGTDPVILIHLSNREDARILSTLEITNVGAGAARNVKLDLQTDISEFVPERIITDFDKVRQTFRTVPQDRSLSFNFGVGFKLLSDPPIPELIFKVSYEDIEGNLHENLQKIDVSELRLQRADESLASRQVKALEKLEKNISKAVGSDGSLSVTNESYDSKRNRRQSEIEKMRKRLQEEKIKSGES